MTLDQLVWRWKILGNKSWWINSLNHFAILEVKVYHPRKDFATEQILINIGIFHHPDKLGYKFRLLPNNMGLSINDCIIRGEMCLKDLGFLKVDVEQVKQYGYGKFIEKS